VAEANAGIRSFVCTDVETSSLASIARWPRLCGDCFDVFKLSDVSSMIRTKELLSRHCDRSSQVPSLREPSEPSRPCRHKLFTAKYQRVVFLLDSEFLFRDRRSRCHKTRRCHVRSRSNLLLRYLHTQMLSCCSDVKVAEWRKL
jgi:hypothetical protein